MKRTLAACIVILAAGAAASMAAVCGEDNPANDAGSPTPSVGTRLEDAPIDELEILILESFPVQYNLRIISGLPSGCAVFDKAEETGRSGNEITVRVTNTMPAGPNVACTAIYGTHEGTLGLGSDFTSGQAYTVRVNDKSTTFTAQ